MTAWPFQQGGSHRCAGFHTLQRISSLNCWKHVPAMASRPIVCQLSNERQSRTRSVARSLTTSIPAHFASGDRPEFRKARCAHHFWSQKCRRLHPLRWELHVLAHLQSSGSAFKTSAVIPSMLSFPSSMFSTVCRVCSTLHLQIFQKVEPASSSFLRYHLMTVREMVLIFDERRQRFFGI